MEYSLLYYFYVCSVSLHKFAGGPPCLWSVPYTGMDCDVSDVFEKLL